MIIVVFSLISCILIAIWITGLQSYVYASSNYKLMNQYLDEATSIEWYFNFALKDNRYLAILTMGLSAFFPIITIYYAMG